MKVPLFRSWISLLPFVQYCFCCDLQSRRPICNFVSEVLVEFLQCCCDSSPEHDHRYETAGTFSVRVFYSLTLKTTRKSCAFFGFLEVGYSAISKGTPLCVFQAGSFDELSLSSAVNCLSIHFPSKCDPRRRSLRLKDESSEKLFLVLNTQLIILSLAPARATSWLFLDLGQILVKHLSRFLFSSSFLPCETSDLLTGSSGHC
jgi:hypothetical protein